MNIDKFVHALQSFNVKNNFIRGEPIKIKYIDVALYSTHLHFSTPITFKFKEEYNHKVDIRLPNY